MYPCYEKQPCAVHCAVHTQSEQVYIVTTVNITEAAKLVGLSRSYFQKKYVKSGQISTVTDKNGHKQIDTSELLRVFGELKDTPVHSDSTAVSEQQSIPDNMPDIEQKIRLAELEVENRMLREQMAEIKEQHSQQVRLLEHITATYKPWWKFWK